MFFVSVLFVLEKGYVTDLGFSFFLVGAAIKISFLWSNDSLLHITSIFAPYQSRKVSGEWM